MPQGKQLLLQAQQLNRCGRRAAQALQEHRQHRCDHDSLPAALAIGIAAIGIAAIRIGGKETDLIDLGHRLLAVGLQRWRLIDASRDAQRQSCP